MQIPDSRPLARVVLKGPSMTTETKHGTLGWTGKATDAEILRMLGAEHLAYAREQGPCYCESRASGHWTANDSEGFSVYKQLAANLRAEGRA